MKRPGIYSIPILLLLAAALAVPVANNRLYWFDCLALVACVVVSALLIKGTLSRHRWLQVVSFTCAALFFIVHVLHSRLEFLWVYLVPHPAVVVVKMFLGYGAAIAILCGLAPRIKKASDRKLLYVISGLILFLCVWIFASQLRDPGVRPTPLWYQETMIQSTNNSCMAAATCTYLGTLGVDLGEGEAVRLGLIGRYGGSETHAWRVLLLLLAGQDYSVHIERTSRAEMAQSGHWYIGATTLTGLIGHAVVYRIEPDGKSVKVRDPMQGAYTLSWEEFRKKWWGVSVWAKQT